jgi:hypothetical protein
MSKNTSAQGEALPSYSIYSMGKNLLKKAVAYNIKLIEINFKNSN